MSFSYVTVEVEDPASVFTGLKVFDSLEISATEKQTIAIGMKTGILGQLQAEKTGIRKFFVEIGTARPCSSCA